MYSRTYQCTFVILRGFNNFMVDIVISSVCFRTRRVPPDNTHTHRHTYTTGNPWFPDEEETRVERFSPNGCGLAEIESGEREEEEKGREVGRKEKC